MSTKLHLRADGHSRPLAFVVSGGQRHEAVFLKPLLEAGSGEVPEEVVGDKGYSYDKLRAYLGANHIEAIIPRRKDQGEDENFDREAYRERNAVERCINRLKQFRRVATRYEKRAGSCLAVLTLAAIVLWL